MRALFWVLLLFALATGVGLLAEINTGYALLVLPPYRVQVSLNLLIVLLVLTFVGAHFLLRVLVRTWGLKGQLDEYRRQRRKDRAGRALRDAIRCHLEGRYGQALKLAGKAASGGDGKGLAALFAARSAHAMRDEAAFRHWLSQAAEHDEEIRTARLMTEVELALEGRRYEEAEARLAELNAGGSRHIAALHLSLQTAQALGKWDEVLRLVRQLVKHKALSSELAEPLVTRAHMEQLEALQSKGPELAAYWQSIPGSDLADATLVERAVPLLVEAGQGGVARAAVEQRLGRDWSATLARYYGDCAEADPTSALQRAERWLKDRPRDAGLLYTLGRLCMAAQLWGKAQSYLEASLAIDARADTHLALAKLAEQMERPSDAQAQYQAAARLSVLQRLP